MQILRAPDDARRALGDARSRGARVAFVPTMGALHDGHLALVREAKRRADAVLVSIFVNPTQFGPSEDFARYPRDLEGDVRKVEGAGAALVFAPDARAMYPEGERTRVVVRELTDRLCGPFRPGHFEGVTTVVAKLFAIAGPCVAIFGRKDYQQLRVIERMTRDLFLPIEIVGHPIVREPSGLAMSSRNAYLSASERARAETLSRGLFVAARAFDAGERRASELERACREALDVDAVDYVSVADPEDLAPIQGDVRQRALVAIAARVGKTRLIDNFVLGEDQIPA